MRTGMTNEEFVKTVNHGRNSKMVAVMIAVYEHPKDFPECYVARVHFIGRGRHWPSPEIFIARATIEEVLAAIPAGMHRMNRQTLVWTRYPAAKKRVEKTEANRKNRSRGGIHPVLLEER